MRTRPVSFVVLAALVSGCDTTDEVTWTQYNAEDNAVTIEVGAADVLPAVSSTLTSNTGSVELGTATVDPGGGPINTTEYGISVLIASDYSDDIGRVTVVTDSGSRGTDEYDLVKDTTGEGIWVASPALQAIGDEGETRSDTLTFRLWTDGDTGSQ